MEIRAEKVANMLNEIIDLDEGEMLKVLGHEYDSNEKLAHHPFLTVRQHPRVAMKDGKEETEWDFYMTPLDVVTAIIRMVEPEKELALVDGKVVAKKIRDKNQ